MVSQRFKQIVASFTALTLLSGSLFNVSTARASNLGSVVPFVDPLLFPQGENNDFDLISPSSKKDNGGSIIPESTFLNYIQSEIKMEAKGY